MRPIAGTLTLRTFVAVLVLALFSTLSAAPQTPARSPIADIGIELPTLGGAKWFTLTKPRFYTPSVMRDIRDNLHATYVRTGWIPGRLHFEKVRWYREDQGMDAICSAGLHAMIIVPSPHDDTHDEDALVDNVREFFARYTQRESGCIRYAEVANEADLPKNGFSDVTHYAAYYRQVAAVLAPIGLTLITSGTSGKDLPWTWALARLLQAPPGVAVGGYGYHPYGVPPAQMVASVGEIARAAMLPDGTLPTVYVTEIGEQNPNDLYEAIVRLAHATPAITIYEYLPQAGEDPGYGLKSDAARYDAVRRAWATLHPAQ